jgi:hypothetical protein
VPEYYIFRGKGVCGHAALVFRGKKADASALVSVSDVGKPQADAKMRDDGPDDFEYQDHSAQQRTDGKVTRTSEENKEDSVYHPAVMLHLALIGLKWVVCVELTQWQPRRAGDVKQGKNVWDFGSAFQACAEFSHQFGSYNALRNNCRRFTAGIVELMNGPDRGVSNTRPVTWTRSRLRELRQQLGVSYLMMPDADLKLRTRDPWGRFIGPTRH